MSENVAISCSPAALRIRRSRERKYRGARIARLELYAEDLAALRQLGWIPSVDCDMETLDARFCAFVNASPALDIKAPGRLP
jgi:hypothetical protein